MCTIGTLTQMLPASLKNKRTTKLLTKSENAKIQKRVAKTKILVK